jgi:hypothetical protein
MMAGNQGEIRRLLVELLPVAGLLPVFVSGFCRLNGLGGDVWLELWFFGEHVS